MASLTKVKLNNIDTSVTFVYDPLVLLNFGATQANTDIGFVFNRDGGISSNVALYWNETLDRIVVGYTSATGLPNGNITLTKYANVAADWYFGNLAGGTTNNIFVSGNVLPTANAFYNFGSPTARWNVGYFAATTLDVGGSQISVDPTNGFKFTVGGTGTPIYLASNGAINGSTLSSATTLTVGTSAAIGTNLTAGGFINAAGNVVAAGAIFNSLRVNGNDTVTGFLNVTGNILGAGGVLNSLTVNGNESVTGFLNVTGNVLSTGAIHNSLTVNGATTQNGTLTVSSGFLNSTGNVLATGGVFNALTVNGNETVTGFLNVTGNVITAQLNAGQINITGNVLATAGTFNALTVNGNESVTGFLNVTGNILGAAATLNGLTVNGSQNISGTVNSGANILAQAGIFNTLQVNGNESVTGFLNVTGNILGAAGTLNTLTVNGLINSTANILSTGAIHNSMTVNGNTTIGAVSVAGVVHTIVGNINQGGAGTVFFQTPGNILAAVGQFGAVNSTGFINTTGNISASQGQFGSINSSGLINTAGNVLAATFSGGQISVTGAVNAGGNVLAAGGVFNALNVNGNLSVGAITVPGTGHSIVGNVTQSGAGTIFYNTPGNIMAAVGRFGSVSSDGFINTSGNVSAAVHLGGQVAVSGLINTAGNVLAATYSGGSVNVTGLINTAGNIIAPSLSIFGNANIGSLTTPHATHVIVGNIRQSGAGTVFFNTTGNISAAIGNFGAINSTGYINTSGNISTPQLNTALINSTGNVLASGGVFGALTVNGGVTSTGFINTSGNVSGAVGLFGSITSTGFINTSGNISTAQLNAGQINTTGNVLATGGVFNLFRVTHQLGGTNSSSFSDSVTTAATANQTLRINGGNQYLFFNANLGAGSYNPFTTVNDIGLIFSGFAGQGTGNLLIAPWNVSQTGIRIIGTTGLVQIPGQLTINANNSPTAIALGGTSGVGNIGVSGTPFNTAFLTTVNATGNVLAGAGTFNALTVNGNESVTGFLNVTGNVLGAGGIFNSLTVNGNQSVTGFLNVTGNVIATVAEVGSIESSGVIYANSTTAGTSATTGALIVAGGIGVGKDSHFGGNLTIDGNLFINGNATTLNTNNLSISDSLIYLATTNPADSLDIGFIGHFINPGYQHTGFVRDASDGVWKLFANVVPEPGTTVDFTNATYSNLLIGNLLARQVTITGLNSAGFINTSGNVSAATVLAGAVTSTGYINTSGNISTAQLNAGQINTTGNVLAQGAVFNSERVNGTSTVNILNSTGNILGTGGIFNSLTVNGGITSTGFINTSGNVSAAAYTGGTINVSGVINTAGNILSTGAVHNSLTVNGNIATANIIATGAGQFSGPFNESTSTSGVFAGNTGTGTPSPRVGFFNGVAAQNWQIDNFFGTFRWYTPGVTRMSLDSNGNLAVSGTANVTYTGSGDSALQITGYASRGGVGYHDFLRVTNTYASATNPNKFFRVDSAGTLQIINSAYTANPLSLTDDGRFSVSGNITAGSLTIPGAQHVLFGNVQINGFGAIQVPAGTTLQRPGSTTAGQIRFNTDTNQFEGYGNAWAAIGGGGGGGGTPGGVSSTVQYNNGGAFGGISVMNFILANSAIIMSSGISSTSTASGALQVIGGVGITENINIGGSITAAGLINTSANVSASQVSAGSVVTTGVINAGGNVLAQVGIFNRLDVNGNVELGFIGTPGAGHSIIGNVTQSGAGTVFYNTPGNIMAAQGFFGSINSTGFINTSGNISAATGEFNNVEATGYINAVGNVVAASYIGGTVSVTGLINTTGNVLATGGIFNALTVNGGITSTGFFNTTANISASVVRAGTITTTGTLTAAIVNSTGNVLATGGIFNALTVNGGITSTGFINTSGNVSGAVILGGTMTTTGTLTAAQVNSTGNILAQGAVFNSERVNGTSTVNVLNSTGNILGTGGIFNSLTVNGGITSSAFINTTANISAAIGNFGSINSTGFINTSGNISGAVVNAGSITTTGALTAASATITAATGRVVLSTDSGGSISMGRVDGVQSFPYIDFNTSATLVDFDVRVMASGNTGTVGGGTLTVTAATGAFTGALNVTGNILAANINAGGVRQTTSATVPTLRTVGDQWYDTSTDTLFQFVNDGTNFYWIDISGQPLNVNIASVQGTSLSITGNGSVTGNLTVGGFMVGKSTQALYADLAEKYTTDAEYDPGTVLIFGGSAEVTQSTKSHDPAIAGVVSTDPAYLMNSGQQGSSVALTGRVPCWVKGPVNKGDRVVSSDMPGIAERLDLTKYQPGCIIGKSLDIVDDGEIKKIEVVVGRL